MSDKPTPTPGPWRIRLDWVRNGDIDICADKSVDVAHVQVRRKPDETDAVPRETALANARLMASAPDLFAALKEIEFTIGTLRYTNDVRDAVIVAARAALAKADGRG